MNRKVEVGKPLTVQPTMTLTQLMERFSTEDACKQFLMEKRWPDGVKCPRCQNPKVYKLNFKPWHWQCRICQKNGYRFSVISKTVFENTNYPLRTWFQVIYLMTQSKKGISALQIHRQIGSGDYRTAWYMCQRVRAAMKDGDFAQLLGQVEVDETYIGGKDKNRHWDKKSHRTGGEASKKIPVIGAISRKGNVVCKMIEQTDRATLNRFVKEAVSDKVTLLATDEHPAYGKIADYPHEIIRHGDGVYVRGDVHTNNIESFWSLLKRGVVGTYHNISRQYLPLYLNEFSFRFNNRKNPDIFDAVIAGC
jgi:transposase-like protein